MIEDVKDYVDSIDIDGCTKETKIIEVDGESVVEITVKIGEATYKYILTEDKFNSLDANGKEELIRKYYIYSKQLAGLI